MSIDQNKIKLIESLYASNILKFGNFKLSSGKNSPYYLNLRIIQSYPDVFQAVVKSYLDMINKIGLNNFDVICGIASAGLVFSSPLSFLTHKSHVYVRNKQKSAIFAGMHAEDYKFSENDNTENVIKLINKYRSKFKKFLLQEMVKNITNLLLVFFWKYVVFLH